jgi:hypothetical protein
MVLVFFWILVEFFDHGDIDFVIGFRAFACSLDGGGKAVVMVDVRRCFDDAWIFDFFQTNWTLQFSPFFLVNITPHFPA